MDKDKGKCAFCSTKQVRGVCRDCSSVGWCSDECKHAHWKQEHSAVCHIISNPMHPENLDKIDSYDKPEHVELLEEALEEALLVAARDPFENDHFIAVGNAIADAIVDRDTYEIDDELVEHAIEWLDAHHQGPNMQEEMAKAEPTEVLFHLEEAIDRVNDECINRLQRYDDKTLVQEQITSRVLASKHDALFELYEKAYDELEKNKALSPETIGAAALVGVGILGKKKRPQKYALRKSTRKVRMPSSGSIRSNQSKVRRAAQRGVASSRRALRKVKKFANRQKKALTRTRKNLRRQAGKVNSLGGGSSLFNQGGGQRTSIFNRGGGTTYSPPPVYVPSSSFGGSGRQTIVLPQVPGGSAPTQVIVNTSPGSLRVRNGEILGGIARELADAKVALSLATTDTQRAIAQARVDALQKQWSEIIRL